MTTIPSKLKGVDSLWKIALEAKEETVVLQAMGLLNKLYTKLGVELENNVAEISSQFVQTAMTKLFIFYKNITHDSEDRNKEIVTLLHLIEDMLGESERKGNYCLTPLYAIFKGTKTKLTIQYFEIGKPTFTKSFTLELHSHVTFGQLKTYIGSEISISPDNVIYLLNIATNISNRCIKR